MGIIQGLGTPNHRPVSVDNLGQLKDTETRIRSSWKNTKLMPSLWHPCSYFYALPLQIHWFPLLQHSVKMSYSSWYSGWYDILSFSAATFVCCKDYLHLSIVQATDLKTTVFEKAPSYPMQFSISIIIIWKICPSLNQHVEKKKGSIHRPDDSEFYISSTFLPFDRFYAWLSLVQITR